ncbi:MAG: S-layer homology domain-containing protein [Oscillospiraceae bacterium]
MVKDSVTNTAPLVKTGVSSSSAAASTYIGKPFKLDLSTVFKDINGDSLTYYAKVDNGSFSAFSGSSYSYTPTEVGIKTLTFKAYDGSAYSDTYTVTLTASAAPGYTTALSGLASYYSALTSYADSNDQWGIADLMAYNASKLTAVQKSAVLEQLISDAYAAHTAAQSLTAADYSGASSCAAKLARCIIVMKALGYDAQAVKTGTAISFNAVKTMNGLIDRVSHDTYGIYTQPYMLIALQQFGTAYSTQIASLKTQLMAAALESGGWGYNSGTDVLDSDTFAPIILALSPYYSETTTYADSANAYKTIWEEIDTCTTTGVINGMQSATGAIYSWGSDNVYDTGLVMAALVSVGKDPASYMKSGKSLVEGLMLYYNAANRFGSAGANDQAFRGLAAYVNFSASGFALFDFSANASQPAYSKLSFSGCPLYFSAIPSGSGFVVTKSGSGTVTPLSAGVYDLPEGSYTYSVSAPSYVTKTGTIDVSSSEANSHTLRTISVSLSSAPAANNNITVTFSIIAPQNNTGYYTYKHDPSVYSSFASATLTLKAGSTVFDALDAGCAAAGVSYVEESYGYISEINGLAQFDYGSKSGWLFEAGSSVPATNCRSYALSSDCSVTWFYTDDYTNEYGSESWSNDSTKASGAIVEGTLNESTGVVDAALSGTGLSEFIKTIASCGDADGSKVPITVTTPNGASAVNLTIPQSALKTLADTNNTSLGVQTNSAGLTFDPAAINIIGESAGDKDVTFSISKTEGSALSEENRALVGSHPVYDLSVSVSGTKISSFGNGSVTVSISYTPKSGEDTSKITAFYIASDGKATQMTGAYYDKASKSIIFKTNHFSAFAVVYGTPKSFADVSESDWYYSAVNFVSQYDLMNGMSDSSFVPDGYMTRAMVVTAIYRLEGEPAVSETNSFTDVNSGQWYTNAVVWASSRGIVSGYGGGLFGTNDTATREQIVAILYNYAKYKDCDVTKTANMKAYTDASGISSWATAAMSWAVAEKIVRGMNSTEIIPGEKATRVQTATMLMKYWQKYMG